MRIARTPATVNADSTPAISVRTPRGATRKRTHAPPARVAGASSCSCTGSPSATATASALASTPRAARQSSASWPPPRRADTFATSGPVGPSRSCAVTGPCSIPSASAAAAVVSVTEAASSGSRSAGQRCASGTANAGGGGGARLVRRPGEPDRALPHAVRRLDDARIPELARGGCGLGRCAARDRAGLGEAGGGEALALPQLGHGERRRLRLQRMRDAEALRDPGGDPDRVIGAGRDEAVHLLRAREPVDRRLVLDRDDRPPVGVAEARRRRVAVGRDDRQPAPPGGGEDSELRRAGAEDEQTHRTIVAMTPAVGLLQARPTTTIDGQT